MAGPALIFRSVPVAVFPQYFAAARTLLSDASIDILAREPQLALEGARVLSYRDPGRNLALGDLQSLGLAGASYDTVVVPCIENSAAPYANLAELARRLARRQVVFLYGDGSEARFDLEAAPAAKLQSHFYDLVYRDYPLAQNGDLRRHVNYLDAVGEIPELSENAVLVIYYHPLHTIAAAFIDALASFFRHSGYPIYGVNAWLGFPPLLERLRYRAVVAHYTLFAPKWFLSAEYRDYFRRSGAHKVAFFQDEHLHMQERLEFLDDCGVDTLYTHLTPELREPVYGRRVGRFVGYLPGYVPEGLPALAARFARPHAERAIDIGYRAERLPFWMGRGSQEKHEIADGFLRHAAERGLQLQLDVNADVAGRLYGDAWHRFLGNCRGILGVESGVSLFDPEGEARRKCEALLRAQPGLLFEEAHAALLHRWDGKIPYRTIGPRHFEAAAFRICQILFEGRYSGVLEPMRHYIPLRKDFSNFDEAIALFADPAVRRELTENAHYDLIESRRYSYARFIEGFDRELAAAGVPLEAAAAI